MELKVSGTLMVDFGASAAVASVAFIHAPASQGRRGRESSGLREERQMKIVIACVSGILLSSVAASEAQVHAEHNFRDRDSHPLATRPGYPLGRADDVRRPGFNGKEWRGESIVGGRTPWPQTWRDPGPAAYGAIGDENAVVYARVGDVVVALSPWEYAGNARLEYARQAWLKEKGYVGGVRTFVNDTLKRPESVAIAETAAKNGKIVPRAILSVPIDMPRFKSHQEVKADDKPASNAATKTVIADAHQGEKLRISWPAGAPKDAVARTEKPGELNVTEKADDAKAASRESSKTVASAEK
jgi:hypothetical protein